MFQQKEVSKGVKKGGIRGRKGKEGQERRKEGRQERIMKGKEGVGSKSWKDEQN